MTNLHQQLLEEFDKLIEPPSFFKGSTTDCFVCGHPVPDSPGAKRAYVWLSQAFRRISAQSEREVVERVRKEIKELKFRDYEGFECRGYDTAGTVNQRLDSVLASLDTLEKKV